MVFAFRIPKEWGKSWDFYLVLHALLILKLAVFYHLFGHGLSFGDYPVAVDLPFIGLPLFQYAWQPFEYVFHQTIHVLIASWVFVLAKGWKSYSFFFWGKWFLVATIIHNIGYWITFSHSSWVYSLTDFARDYVGLWFFLGLFVFVFHLLPFLRKINLPVLDVGKYP